MAGGPDFDPGAAHRGAGASGRWDPYLDRLFPGNGPWGVFYETLR